MRSGRRHSGNERRGAVGLLSQRELAIEAIGVATPARKRRAGFGCDTQRDACTDRVRFTAVHTAGNARRRARDGSRAASCLAHRQGSGTHQQPEDRSAAVVDDVEFTARIDAEGAHVPYDSGATQFRRVLDNICGRRFAAGRIHIDGERPHSSGDEVGEEVAPKVPGSKSRSAIDESTRDRLADRVVVLVNRIDERYECGRQGRDVVVRTFAIAPPVITPATTRRLVIDLLPRSLPDIRDDGRPASSSQRIIEAPAPRVAQAERLDLGQRAEGVAGRIRIVRRHEVTGRIGVGNVHVDPQHLAQQVRGAL